MHTYFRMAITFLLRKKFFAFISLFGISFTLMVLMVATSILENIFGEMPPEVNLHRTLGVTWLRLSNDEEQVIEPPGFGFLNRYVRTLPLAETVAIHSLPMLMSTYYRGKKIELHFKRTDGEFWQIMKFHFLEGEPYTAEDENNSNFVCVINNMTKEKFFGKESAAGRYIEVNRQRFRIVGVVKDVPSYRFAPFADVWAPISTNSSGEYRNQVLGDFVATVLVKDKNDIIEIRNEYENRLEHLDMPLPLGMKEANGGMDTFFEELSRFIFSPAKMEESHPVILLGLLVGLMILYMILPAINLININVSRISERISEIGIRKASGATALNLAGQFIVENIIITVIGGLIGFILSIIILKIVNGSGIIPYAELTVNIRIFVYGLMISFFFGLLSGVYPAWKMSRMHPVVALRGDTL